MPGMERDDGIPQSAHHHVRYRGGMSQRAIQDDYPDDVAHCYGCGRLNETGLHIRSFWDGDETVCRLRPRPEHTAVPGYVYGGLIASLIDCHGTGSAALAASRARGPQAEGDPPLRFLTASLHVDYLAPTPLDTELEARGTIREIKGRKVVTDITVRAGGRETARGYVIAVQAPDEFIARLAKQES
jgi:acyl-coenzyme A thioesterase PaaI-like protein